MTVPGPSALAVFLRPVVEGEVKTRLAATLGPRGAASLYRAFLADTLDRLRRVARERGTAVTLWVAGDPEHPSLRALGADWPRRRQPRGDLGRRQEAALREGLRHHGRALCIGTDMPSLPTAHVVAAIDALEDRPAVIGPTADGGYYLLGLSRPCADGLLSRIRWSSRHTLTDTRERLTAHGMTPLHLPPHYDVDDGDDLRLLRTQLQLDPSAAPRTAAALAELGLD